MPYDPITLLSTLSTIALPPDTQDSLSVSWLDSYRMGFPPMKHYTLCWAHTNQATFGFGSVRTDNPKLVHLISGRGAGNYGAGCPKPGRLQNRDTQQKPNVRHYALNRLNHGQMVVVASIRSIQTFYASIDKNNHQ